MVKKLTICVAVLMVLLGGIAIGQSTRFEDVPEGHYAADAASWAAAAGVTAGCTDTEFCPDDALTRGQMITFLHRYHTKVAAPATVDAVASATDAWSKETVCRILLLVEQLLDAEAVDTSNEPISRFWLDMADETGSYTATIGC